MIDSYQKTKSAMINKDRQSRLDWFLVLMVARYTTWSNTFDKDPSIFFFLSYENSHIGSRGFLQQPCSWNVQMWTTWQIFSIGPIFFSNQQPSIFNVFPSLSVIHLFPKIPYYQTRWIWAPWFIENHICK